MRMATTVTVPGMKPFTDAGQQSGPAPRGLTGGTTTAIAHDRRRRHGGHRRGLLNNPIGTARDDPHREANQNKGQQKTIHSLNLLGPEQVRAAEGRPPRRRRGRVVPSLPRTAALTELRAANRAGKFLRSGVQSAAVAQISQSLMTSPLDSVSASSILASLAQIPYSTNPKAL
jgi:hypothetical protein